MYIIHISVCTNNFDFANLAIQITIKKSIKKQVPPSPTLEREGGGWGCGGVVGEGARKHVNTL